MNPSWEAVRLLPSRLALGAGAGSPALMVRSYLLPVTFDGAARQVRELISRHCPDVVVHVGVNEKADAIMLEALAVNEQTARIPDNGGDQPHHRPVVPGGPQVLHSTWAAPVLAGRLRAAGLPAAVSEDAGRYVCNSTLYTALDALGPGEHRPTGFVHVPAGQVVPTPQVALALETLLAELAGQVLRQRMRAQATRMPGDDALAQAVALATALGAGRTRPLRVGVTGGIGSGKSTLSRLLARAGAHLVDADALAREVIEPGQPALAEVALAFGDQVLNQAGGVDRAALAAAVFGPQASPGSRERLDAIMLPRIAAEAAYRMDAGGPAQVSVYDVPLLTEGGMADLLDVVVVVDTALEARLVRLEARGLPRHQALARMRHQATDAQRREVADVVVPNDGDEAAFGTRVDRLWELLVQACRDHA